MSSLHILRGPRENYRGKSATKWAGMCTHQSDTFPASIDPGWMLVQTSLSKLSSMRHDGTHGPLNILQPFPGTQNTLSVAMQNLAITDRAFVARPALRLAGGVHPAKAPVGHSVSLPRCRCRQNDDIRPFVALKPMPPLPIVGPLAIWCADSGDAGGGQTPGHQWRREGFQDRTGL